MFLQKIIFYLTSIAIVSSVALKPVYSKDNVLATSLKGHTGSFATSLNIETSYVNSYSVTQKGYTDSSSINNNYINEFNVAYSLESDLPIIIIDNNGKPIPDDPRDIATMKVINNVDSAYNRTADSIYEYNGKISIEKRGSSSQFFFPKNSFALETQTDTGSNNNVSLLGLPKENDWILYAPYSDKTFMRNSLAYHLANQTGRWSPRTRFCEVIVNDEYQGIYVLVEKIKRDKNRLDIAKLRSDENAGDSLTGGYILKIDRGDDYWASPFTYDGEVNINYFYPEPEDITTQQREYIEGYITEFETALDGDNYTDSLLGYRKYINVESFIDYYLLNEFSKNVDAYILSTFFYKDKDSKDPKVVMGPFWDYNLAYGNAYYRGGFDPEGWIEDANEAAPFWFYKLLDDPYYQSDLKKRWVDLRTRWLTKDSIFHFIDSIALVTKEAKVRNFDKWPVLGTYVWPNSFIGKTYEDEISYMKKWVSDRLKWMDEEIEKYKIIVDSVEPSNFAESFMQDDNLLVYPNPFSNKINVAISYRNTAAVRLKLFSLTGQVIYEQESISSVGANQITFNVNELHGYSGILIYSIIVNDQLISSGKIVKQ